MDELREKLVYFDAATARPSMDDAVSLNSLVKDKINEDEFNAIFGITNTSDVYQQLNMKLDKKTKYIHDHNYYVKSYNSNNIFISNGAIIYKEIEKMPNDVPKDDIIRRDLFNQAMLMLSIYMGFVDNLNEKFVKENFSSFSAFIPEEDRGYYSGIIERSAGIYYNEFAQARSEKKLNEYKTDLDNNGSSALATTTSKALIKSTASGKIYETEDEMKPAAFISVYFYAMMTMVGFIIGVIYLFVNLFK